MVELGHEHVPFSSRVCVLKCYSIYTALLVCFFGFFHKPKWSCFFSFLFFSFFSFFFRATPMAHGSFQAQGLIGAADAGLCHSHSNSGSKPHLQSTPQLMATPEPTEGGQGSNPHPHGYLSGSLQLSHDGNSLLSFSLYSFLPFFFFSLFKATLAAYRSSWARGWIGATATATPDLSCICNLHAACGKQDP